ncbi:MAG: hydroxymethylglutaryl-CoA lyase [Pseudomonadota bacterium]|nr:hydroxymethylglutaryl-CoA lyase [Pseudomonadota bacterium]
MSTMDAVTLCECFARDGLQHEPAFVPTAAKRALVERFAELGFKRVEATSYSNPMVVPQFADASELLKSLNRKPNTFYKATCANLKAVERALADLEAGHGANEISLLVSATEAHTQKNLNRTRAEQWRNVEEMARAARGRFRLVGTVSVAFGCPFEGKVDPGVVVEDVQKFRDLGVEYVALGDTIGAATPVSVKNVFKRIEGVTAIAHFHDTRGTGLANYIAAYEAGVRHFDSSFGGVGGHPAKLKYGGGFTGNVCTEDLVNLFEAMGIPTGIDLDGLLGAAELCERTLGRELYGRVTRSGLSPLISSGSSPSRPRGPSA